MKIYLIKDDKGQYYTGADNSCLTRGSPFVFYHFLDAKENIKFLLNHKSGSKFFIIEYTIDLSLGKCVFESISKDSVTEKIQDLEKNLLEIKQILGITDK